MARRILRQEYPRAAICVLTSRNRKLCAGSAWNHCLFQVEKKSFKQFRGSYDRQLDVSTENPDIYQISSDEMPNEVPGLNRSAHRCTSLELGLCWRIPYLSSRRAQREFRQAQPIRHKQIH
jgi:hypothetical protein